MNSALYVMKMEDNNINTIDFKKIDEQVKKTADGLFINCQGFYHVFCELEKEEKSRIGNSEDIERERGIFLAPAMITNGVLSTELALKFLICEETIDYPATHRINDLFECLPDKHRQSLSKILKDRTHQNDSSLKKCIDQISDAFVQWRYSNEHASLGYSGFLMDFIHIVFGYAGDVYNSIYMSRK